MNAEVEKGVITNLTGNVTATALTGKERTLEHGDHVYIDEVVTTAKSACIEIVFPDGSIISLGRNSQVVLEATIF